MNLSPWKEGAFGREGNFSQLGNFEKIHGIEACFIDLGLRRRAAHRSGQGSFRLGVPDSPFLRSLAVADRMLDFAGKRGDLL